MTADERETRHPVRRIRRSLLDKPLTCRDQPRYIVGQRSSQDRDRQDDDRREEQRRNQRRQRPPPAQHLLEPQEHRPCGETENYRPHRRGNKRTQHQQAQQSKQDHGAPANPKLNRAPPPALDRIQLTPPRPASNSSSNARASFRSAV